MRLRGCLTSTLGLTLLLVNTGHSNASVNSEDDEPVPAAKPAPKDLDDGAEADAEDGAEAEPVEKPKPKAKPKAKSKTKAKPKADSTDEDDETPGGMVGTVTGGPTSAGAAVDEPPARVNFTAELVAGTPIDSSNRDLYGFGGGGGLGAEIYILPLLGIHVEGNFLLFSKGKAAGSTNLIAGGVGPRLHFGTALFGELTRHDAWFDAHINYGSSGGIGRPGFDAAAAVQWEVAPDVRLGPVLRYQFGSDPLDKNAQLITAGITLTYGGRTTSAAKVEAPVVEADSDNDGVPDGDDECPKKSAGERPDPEHIGCPLPDGDEDGVPDAEDECLKEPAGDNPNPKRPGCPAPKAEEKIAKIKGGKIEIFQQVYFETNSATIEERSNEVLQVVGKLMRGLNGKRVRIEGHTDDVGTDAYNLDLSKRRARAVAQWLVQYADVDAAQLETEGYGKSRPLVKGGSDTDPNRRVEFVIIDE